MYNLQRRGVAFRPAPNAVDVSLNERIAHILGGAAVAARGG